jgi:hypothetical protein
MGKRNFVYLYTNPKGQPMYVGYGSTAQRALSHRGGSHNRELKAWLKQQKFNLKIAGPYPTEREAKAVEAALISSMHPRFNLAPGDGPKFLPVGVPADLWERPSMAPLTLRELGVKGKGVLLVYLAPGDYLRDGRRKFDPATPSDKTAFRNIEKNWDISRLINIWRERPDLMPRTILGVHGKVDHRFIVGSLEIDRSRLCDYRNRRYADRWPGPRWRVPVLDSTELDFCELRGRRVEGVQFGQFSHQLHIWVDGKGRRRH